MKTLITPDKETKLTIHHGQKISYKGQAAAYEVLGSLSMDLGVLKVSIHITEPFSNKKYRIRLDLFDSNQVENICNNLSEKEGINANLLELDLLELTDELSKYREDIFDKEMGLIVNNDHVNELTPMNEVAAHEFLKQKNVLGRIDSLIQEAGIIGEEGNRKTLFVIASSYKMPYPLHALVQGGSGSGKSHLINGIVECMPQEEVKDITRATGKSFYHYGSDELMNKLLVIQDISGLGEDAQYALRELQSAKSISSAIPTKDRLGQMKSREKIINAHFASLMATTKGEIYFDNMSRSICLSVDESTEQTSRIIDYNNKVLTGQINKTEESQAKQQLRNIVRVLKSYEVINQYADQIRLPVEAKMLRRLNSHFQNFVSQVTLINQYQRKSDNKGRLITTKEDIKQAVDVFFSSILLKVDELDGSTRQFYDGMKAKIIEGKIPMLFTPKDIRSVMNLERTRVFEQLKVLRELEYICIDGGTKNKGYQYQISEWDFMRGRNDKIRTELENQIKSLI